MEKVTTAVAFMGGLYGFFLFIRDSARFLRPGFRWGRDEHNDGGFW